MISDNPSKGSSHRRATFNEYHSQTLLLDKYFLTFDLDINIHLFPSTYILYEAEGSSGTILFIVSTVSIDYRPMVPYDPASSKMFSLLPTMYVEHG